MSEPNDNAGWAVEIAEAYVWRASKGQGFLTGKRRGLALAKEVLRLRRELKSIADNTCCGGCQEAARVAAKAIGRAV